MEPLEKIKSIFEKYTSSYHFYLQDYITGKEIELGEKKRYPISSCFKLAVLMALFDSLKNESDIFNEIVVPPNLFSPGGGIINYFSTPVKFTYFQMAQMMMAFSDGTATDVLIRTIGIERINSKLCSLTLDSSVKLNLGEMVSLFQKHYNSAAGEREEKLCIGGKVLSDIAFTNAVDLCSLARAAYDYSESINYQTILRIRKYMPRTDMYFCEKNKFIGKTGSIGFGYFINDCGIIESNGKPIASMAYTTSGWSVSRELAELKCAYIGVQVCKALGLFEFSERFNAQSEKHIE